MRRQPSTAFTTVPFIGREAEIEQGLRALDAAANGESRFVLVSGEAGIGKTRLLGEIERHARRRKARVDIGRCADVEGVPPLWPWVQILGGALATASPAAVRRWLGSGLAEVAQLLPQLAERMHIPPTSVANDPAAARFRLLASVASALLRMATRHLTLLLVEDIHWADAASLELLELLVGQLHGARLLVLATCREPAEVGGLLRHSWSQGIALRGFSEEEAARCMRACGGEGAAAAASRVVAHTGGNPLFVTEMARASVAGLPEAQIPETLQEVIQHRAGRLPSACQSALRVAAVIGQRFAIGLVASVADGNGDTADSTSSLLHPAIRAGLVAVDASSPAHGRFVHALIRDALHATIDKGERLRLHRAVAETVEMGGARTLVAAAELAYHWSEAVSDATSAAKAVRYLCDAGEIAVSSRAYEDGVEHYRRAYALIDTYPGAVDPRTEVQTVFALADALDRVGQREEAKRLFRHVVVQARTQGDAEMQARAVLGLGGWLALTYHDEGTIAGMLQEAERALGDSDSALRASILARLAMELAWLNAADSLHASERAVAMAQRVGDPAAFAWAVHAHHSVVPDPRRTPELLALADATVHQAEAAGDLDLSLIGHRWRIYDFLVAGDVINAVTEIGVYRTLARDLRSTFHEWTAAVYENLHALLEGRFAETAERGQAAREIGQRLQHLIGEGSYGAQLYIVLREQSTITPGFAAAVKAYADANPHHLSARCMAAMAFADAGDLEAARRGIEYFATNDFAELFESFDWLVCSAYLAEACVRLGDEPYAQLLYERLLAASGLMVVANPSVFYGAVDHYLGRLALTMRRYDDALAHLEAALSQYRRMGARPSIAHALYEMAATLRARGHDDDLPKAQTLFARVVAAAHALGMTPLLEQAQTALAAASVVTAEPDDYRSQPIAPHSDALRKLYGLTPTEARLALLLAEGHRVDSAAAQLDISVHTARTHLKRIFAKTDAHHQGDLVRLVLSVGVSPRR